MRRSWLCFSGRFNLLWQKFSAGVRWCHFGKDCLAKAVRQVQPRQVRVRHSNILTSIRSLPPLRPKARLPGIGSTSFTCRWSENQGLDFAQVQKQGSDLLQHLRQALDLLQEFCRQKPEALFSAYDDLAGRFNEALTQAEAETANPQLFWDRLQPLLFSSGPETPASPEAIPSATYASLQEVLDGIDEQRLQEMFCLSLRSQVTKKQAISLVTGRLVPILVIDAGGGLSSPGPTVTLDDVASIPYKAFLTGMLSIPWPKARPLDMKGFISVIGVTSTTPGPKTSSKRSVAPCWPGNT